MSSTTATAYAVICPTHGTVYLTDEEYELQLLQANDVWRCTVPNCGAAAEWNDAHYECWLDRLERTLHPGSKLLDLDDEEPAF